MIRLLARSARPGREKRGPAPGFSAGCLTLGLAQVDALQRELCRFASHTLKQPALVAAWEQPHGQTDGVARRSSPSVSASDQLGRTSASAHASHHRGMAVSLLVCALPLIPEYWSDCEKKPLERLAKKIWHWSSRTALSAAAGTGSLPEGIPLMGIRNPRRNSRRLGSDGSPPRFNGLRLGSYRGSLVMTLHR